MSQPSELLSVSARECLRERAGRACRACGCPDQRRMRRVTEGYQEGDRTVSELPAVRPGAALAVDVSDVQRAAERGAETRRRSGPAVSMATTQTPGAVCIARSRGLERFHHVTPPGLRPLSCAVKALHTPSLNAMNVYSLVRMGGWRRRSMSRDVAGRGHTLGATGRRPTLYARLLIREI